MRTVSGFLCAAMLAATLAVPPQTAVAQSPAAGCTIEQIGGTSRSRLRCAGGLSIVVEAGAGYRLIDRGATGSVDTVRLDRGALLLEVPQGRPGPGVEVVTPQAIAAVRGTHWAVDVEAAGTSVFVVRGQVAVRRSAGGSQVLLGPGEGVDVDGGGEPLEVRRWPARRVAALMARFGQ